MWHYKGDKNVQFDESNDNDQGRGRSGRISRRRHRARAANGVGRRLGERLLNELEAMVASFITCYIVANCEERFYQSLGFCENEGHLLYYIDKRLYV
jgi:hypothetical protein